MIENKIAVFDFCGTIVNFQTADPYLMFVLDNEKIDYHTWNNMIIRFANKLWFRLFNISASKNYLISKTKNIGKDKLEQYGKEYYLKYVKPNFVNESIQLLNDLKKQGYEIVIASAGINLYIQYFAEEYGIKYCFSTELKFKGNYSAGRIRNRDLIGKYKVKRLVEGLGMENLKNIDSIAVSDSKSDMPLFDYCSKNIVVCKEVPGWVGERMEILKCS